MHQLAHGPVSYLLVNVSKMLRILLKNLTKLYFSLDGANFDDL